MNNVFDENKILNDIANLKSDNWEKVRENKSLELFKKASEKVPAYSEFLKSNNINPEEIKSWEDFQKIPFIDKKNYLKKYDFEDLLWDGNLNKTMVFTSTSGSTGEPFYFVRQEELERQYSLITDLYLRQNPKYINKTTLVMVCFAMGIWIGGTMTYKAYEISGKKNNLPLSIITPGISKKDIFNALKNLAPKYENVIIVGYAPFVKDIVDEAPKHDIDLNKINIRYQFAAEAITENFRDYLISNSNVDNFYLDTLNIYGSADIGAMAFETATSILIKRLALNNKDLFYDIFSPINKTPTLAQFIPEFINFEEVNGQILLTGNSAMPLVRYSIGDNGGVLTFDQIQEKLKKYGLDIYEEAKKLGIERFITQFPFVYVYERANLSISYYGLNLYPEWLKDTFIDSEISNFLTGKFLMNINFDGLQNQELQIIIEKKQNIILNQNDEMLIQEKIISSLRTNSSEYRELIDKIGVKAHPKLIFVENGDQNYFVSGAKHKWVKN